MTRDNIYENLQMTEAAPQPKGNPPRSLVPWRHRARGIVITAVLLLLGLALATSLLAVMLLYLRAQSKLQAVGEAVQKLQVSLQPDNTSEASAKGLDTLQLLDEAQTGVRKLKAQLGNVSAVYGEIQIRLDNVSAAYGEIQIRLDNVSAAYGEIQIRLDNVSAAYGEIQIRLDNVSAAYGEIQIRLDNVSAARAAVQGRCSDVWTKLSRGWRFYGGNLYYFSQERKSWDEAERFCVSQDSHLTSVSSQAEQEFLSNETQGDAHWIGLTDRQTEGSWRWADGTEYRADASRGFWEEKQPDNWHQGTGGREDCVETRTNELTWWNDANCSLPSKWICKQAHGWAGL